MVLAVMLQRPGPALSEAIYFTTAGQAHLAFSPRDPLRAPGMTDFAHGDQVHGAGSSGSLRLEATCRSLRSPSCGSPCFSPRRTGPLYARDAETR